MKQCLAVTVVAIIFFSFIACEKKEKPASQTPIKQGPIMDSPLSLSDHAKGPKVELNVVVPQDVKDNWSAVKLLLEDKELKTTKEYTVKIGDELKVPDSKLSIKVEYFLPDFKMSGPVITSASNTPNNPSAGVVIYEDGKQIFPDTGKLGWLYSKFPAIHQFQHARYGLILKEGIENK